MSQPQSKPLPFTKILVRIRCNPAVALEQLVPAGLPLNARTGERDQAIIARYEAEAKANGTDPYFMSREDRAGTRRSDSGIPVFGKQGAQNVCPATLRTDLEAMGYVMVGATVLNKEGDEMYFLVLTFLPSVTGIEPAALTGEATAIIGRVMAKNFQYMHVWKNPDGSATVNPAHVGDVNRGTKNLRLSAEGEFTLEAR